MKIKIEDLVKYSDKLVYISNQEDDLSSNKEDLEEKLNKILDAINKTLSDNPITRTHLFGLITTEHYGEVTPNFVSKIDSFMAEHDRVIDYKYVDGSESYYIEYKKLEEVVESEIVDVSIIVDEIRLINRKLFAIEYLKNIIPLLKCDLFNEKEVCHEIFQDICILFSDVFDEK